MFFFVFLASLIVGASFIHRILHCATHIELCFLPGSFGCKIAVSCTLHNTYYRERILTNRHLPSCNHYSVVTGTEDSL